MTSVYSARPLDTDRLSAAKRALLQRRLAGLGTAPATVASRDDGPVPLSPVQRAMWAVDQMLDDNSVYSVHRVLRLRGPLDVTALQAALNDLVRRHEVLGATYGGDPPVQRAGEVDAADLTRVDLTGMSAAARARKADKLVRAEVAEPFDLGEGPLLRCLLIALAADEHLLVLNTHHIVNDEWSFGVIAQDLSALYTVHATGTGPTLAPLPIRYADYARQQVALARSPAHAEQVRYWRDALADVPRTLALPVDHPYPAVAEYEGDTLELALPPEVSRAVRQLAAAHRVTLFTALLSMFAVALRTWSGQHRFAIGTVLSGRGLAETEPLAGLFVNTAAIPVDLRDEPTFTQVLRRTHAAVLGALDHQDVTFTQVVHELGVRRDPARNPVYQVLFQHFEAGAERWALPGITVEQVDLGIDSAKVDLTLFTVSDGDTISLALNYKTGLFEKETARRLLDEVADLAAALAAEPDAPIPTPRVTAVAEPAPTVHTGARADRDSDTVRTLVDVWSRVLRIDDIEPEDNFFEIGGDSMLLIRMVAEARTAGLTLTAKDVFTHQTIVELAAALDGVAPPAVADRPDFALSGLDRAALAAVTEGRDVADVYPLTPLQAGMLVHSQVEPEGYLRQFTVCIDRPLDVDAFEAAWQRVVDRHAVLRSRFVWQDLPHPVQVVEAAWPVRFTRVELTDAAFEAFLAEERGRAFDLAAAPPSRFTLVRLGPDRHRLVWSTHHLVFDGWSISIILDEVFTAYDAFCVGREPELPAPARLRDYLAWRREQPTTTEFWQSAVGDASEPTPLPACEPPTDRTGVESRIEVLPAQLRDQVRAAARAHRVTVGALLHAAWALLLQRHTGRRGVLFGTVAAGRSAPVPGIERMVGLLANTLPLRIEVEPAAAIGDWLRAVQGKLLEVREHEHWSLVDVQRAIGFTGGRRLFDTIFLFTQNEPGSAADRSGVRVEGAAGETGTGYPLAMEVRADGEMSLRLTYDRGLFSDAAAGVLQDHYAQILWELSGAQASTVEQVTMASAVEQDVLWQWGTRDLDRAVTDTVCDLFDQCVLDYPDAPAVIDGALTLSYAELAARANRLAHLLRSRGVREEIPVAVALPKSAGFVVAVLGVLKAGGFYVPLDPANPPERTAWTLRDCGARTVLTSAKGRAVALPDDDGLDVIDLDAADVIAALAGQPDSAPPGVINPGSAINVLYTSGSTGQPKGAQQTHQGVVRLVHEPTYANAGPGDVFLLFSPVAFDGTNIELWWALCTGAALAVTPPGPLSAEELAGLLRDTKATVLWLSAGLFAQLVDHDPAALRGVRVMMSGGDVLSPQPVRTAMAANPGMTMVNGYGPMENTVFTTALRLPDADLVPDKLPIGTTVPYTSVYVLDENLDLAPIGVVGEVYCAGPGLARGYVNRPGGTAEKFLPDPFSTQPGARMYRSGDLARWRPDGLLDFCGRADNQVKIRGFRVETGEVEARIAEHDAVQSAAVAAWTDPRGHKRLVGYLVPVPGTQPPSAGELRAFLRDRLPEYMVPSLFSTLDELPISPSGKVDRRRLPAPDLTERTVAASAEPATETERRIAEVWRAELGVGAVGRDDNFFELGGDSILSLRIAARARRAGLAVTPRQVFAHQTVAALAAAIDAEAAPAVVADQGLVSGAVALTPIVRWFTEQRMRHDHFAQSVRLRWSGTVDPAALATALTALVTHHDALRMRLTPTGATISSTVDAVPIDTVDLGAVPAGDRAAVIDAAATRAHASHDLASGALVRAVLVRAAEPDGDQVILSVHHLAVDTVSWAVLLEDLATAYGQARGGQPVALPAKTSSFQQWAGQLARYATGADFADQAAFWTAAAQPRRQLPADRPDGDNLVSGSATIVRSLSVAETDALTREVTAAFGAKVSEALLTALARAVRRWAGPGPVPIDVEGHGREPLFDDLDVSRTVGWFTSVYPLTLDLPDGDVVTALESVRDQWRAVPHHGVGFGIARYLRPVSAAVLATAGDPPVSFNYHSRTVLSASGESAVPLFTRLDPAGVHVDPEAPRAHEFDVTASVQDGRLHIGWTYPTSRYEESTVAGLAEAMLAELRDLVARCDTDSLRPARFPLAGLDRAGLDRVLAATDPATVEDVYPLSPLQVGILYHSLADPDGSAYHIQAVYDIDGDLSVAEFTAAWQHVYDRHTALRSTFRWEGLPRPVQVVHRPRPLTVNLREWTGEADYEQLLADSRRAGFDLVRGPVMYLDLIRIGPRRHRLVWHFHHLVLDGWCVRTVLDEVREAYAALRAGNPPDLPPAVPFREHIAWLEARGGIDTAFWTERLAGMTAATSIPLVAPAAQGRSGVGVVERDLPAHTAEVLRALCRERRITVSGLLQAAWGLVLGRYSGEDDVVFGSTQAGRSADLAGIDRMVGLLISTLPARLVIDPAAVAADWLTDAHARLLELRDHEHDSLSAIQRCTGVPADQAMFTSIFVTLIQSLGDGGAGTDGLVFTPREGYEKTGYPLLIAAEIGETIGFRLTYDPARVTPTGAQRLLGTFARIVESIADRPTARVADLGALALDQAELVLDQWNRTDVARADDRSIVELVRDRAALVPDATALVFGADRLTYAQLRRASDGLAAHLRGRGIGAGDLVGVHLHRSLDMVVALLGILGAGAAYLPLDPTYPADRLSYIVEDSSAVLVLTTRDVPPIEGSAVPVLRLEDVPPPAHIAPLARPGLDELAYCLYTSGSTGRPKGVDISHGALRNLLTAIAERLGSTAADRWLGLTSLSFDISGLEIFLPLMLGGSLVIVPDEVVYDGDALVALVRGTGVTHVQATPSAWQMLLAAGFDEPAVTALSGGEPLPLPLARQLAQRCGRLVNVYGPTETTIWSTLGTVERGTGVVSVGRPLHNTQVYLLDDNLDPVPAGAIGELYIGGAGLARGYRDRPGLTADRFRPDPFGAPGGRLYATGDRARHLDDGRIEVLGRVDNQVKIRGHRIELGEIEAVLLGHDDVAEAAVMPRDGRLVAYVVPAPGRAAETRELRRHLLRSLPAYMVPGGFVRLAKMPLTPNGKLDRRALPAAPETSAEPAAIAVPRTDTERRLAEVWATVLERETVGVNQNYYELGGDSLRSIQIVAACRTAGLAVAPRDLIAHQTIADLAAALDAGATTAAPSVRDLLPGGDPAQALRRYQVPAVAVAQLVDGEVHRVWAHGTGPDTPFAVGSLSKHVTAYAVLRLVDDGVLDLDEPIGLRLTAWRAGEPAEWPPLTLRHLLAHTAGLTVRGGQVHPVDAVPTLDGILAGVRAERPAGAGFAYSATHYTVVQRLLEEVTGEPFAHLCRRLVFQPLGMAHTAFMVVGPTTGHRGDGTPVPPLAVPELAAAGLWSTAGDLALLAREVYRATHGHPEALLTRSSAVEMTTTDGGYGLGTVVAREGRTRWCGHHGDVPGYRAVTVLDPDTGTGLVVLANSDAGAQLIHDLQAELHCGPALSL
jgi:amino acid adenylation domain-containing protein/non-ribosomal peptide synthase protein (TIGR01720 family)